MHHARGEIPAFASANSSAPIVHQVRKVPRKGCQTSGSDQGYFLQEPDYRSAEGEVAERETVRLQL